MTCRVYVGALDWEDALDAAKTAGAMADQWATAEAIDGDAFQWDANKTNWVRSSRQRYRGLSA